MYIKDIVLDGFKSYRTRTEVKGFDKQFNAITGLNGSGKSNILDSICFVLGITNLSQVRAGQLQDLVFKNGQAGITKATVTITFDNTDREQCPTGYEEFREITITRQVIIGGKNRYMINGSNVQNRRVQDLFCSVQLNVNNPNFLIMQGRITKVLNMKPPEILAMIEEAAGTHMYETKKQEAKRTIVKKDAKLGNIIEVLETDIGPKLKKLKDERQQYLEYQRIERELEHTNRLWAVSQLLTLRHNRELAEKNLKNLKHDISIKHQTIKDNIIKIDEFEDQIKQINEMVDKEAGGGKLKELENRLRELRKVEVTIEAEFKNSKETVSTEEANLKQLEKDLHTDQKALQDKQNELEKFESMFSKLKDAEAADSAALELAEKRLEAASTGNVINEDGEVGTIQSHLIAAQQEEAEAYSVIRQLEIELKHALSQLKEKEAHLKGSVSDFDKDKKTLNELEANIAKHELCFKEAQKHYTEERAAYLNDRRKEIIVRIRDLRAIVDSFEYQYPQVVFRYKDPEPNFNRSRVYGTVCKLLIVKDAKYCTALEIAASSKLYNVVVDNEVTSKLILENGQLLSRKTIIPINKINARTVEDSKLRLAQQIVGSDNVFSCLSLINFDPKLKTVMEYVFGQTLIVSSSDVGIKLAFDERIRIRCISLDGDCCDPAGVLCGGSRGAIGAMLIEINKLRGSMEELDKLEEELNSIEIEKRNSVEAAEKYRTSKEQLDLAKHRLNVVKERLAQTDHNRKKTEVEELKASIDKMTTQSNESKLKQSKCQAKVIKLKKQIADVENNRENILQDVQNEVKKLKIQASQSRKEWQKKEGLYNTLKLEIIELNKWIDECNIEIEKAVKSIEITKEKSTEYETKLNEAKVHSSEAEAQVKHERNEITKKTKEIQQLSKQIKQLTEENGELKLEIQKLNYDLEKLEKDFDGCRVHEKRLIDANEWLMTDTRYTTEVASLNERERKDLGNRLKQLKEKHNNLGRVVNARALSLLETEEEKFQELTKRKKTIENDKKSIMGVIENLDEKKEAAIIKAWEEVNKNFGSIFASLLPGTDAKLQPQNSKNILEGLEVKVSFGGIWKDSLGELSGGQRSLIALSLILAMLKFKPAPLYILDEVDAALDLSHTQNIGNMLRTHFQNSQFIVVSLKDGMFNNANVLFRTQFVDGVSTVCRTECRK